MQVDLEELRRYYASLSDQALLELRPDDLTDVANECCDAELLRRGLRRPEESADEAAAHEDPCPDEAAEWGEARRLFMRSVPWAKNAVTVHTFSSAPEAEQARDALEEAGIPAAIAGDEIRSARFNLMVPEASLEDAQGVLDAAIFHPVFEDTLEGHFAVFTDEELADMDRELLPASARASYDEEMEARGLSGSVPDALQGTGGDGTQDGFVAAATLLGAEAEVGKSLLDGARIPCRLENDDSPTPLEEYQGVRLMVPPALFDRACEILQDNAAKIIAAVRTEE